MTQTATSPLPKNFRLAPADPQTDLMPMAQLTADIFSGGQYVEGFANNYIGNSHYDWNVSRLVWDGEKLVHHWGVWGYRMRLESIELKVATHESCRKLGLMHHAAESSFDAMRRDGYDLSILRGRHYVKMGYARAWNYVTYYVKPDELPAPGTVPPYQSLPPGRVPEMDALYNREYASYIGTAVRPTYRNRHSEDIGVYAWCEDMGVYAWREDKSRLEGYVRALPSEDDPKTFLCLEACGDPHQGLAVMKELFAKSACEKLGFFTLPHLHPILQILRQGAVIVENRYFDISGWRVKIINLSSTLEKIRPLLEQRLERSLFSGWRGTLGLDTGEQKTCLRLEAGAVSVTTDAPGENRLIGGPGIARLLIGSDEPGEIIRQENVTCTGIAAHLAAVLFPDLHPMMSHWDEY
jgi:hypothetical protein